MTKSEMFATLLTKASEECECTVEHILGPHRVHVLVNARILIVNELRYLGLSHDDIAMVVLKAQGHRPPLSLKEVKLKAKHINKLYNLYSKRIETDRHFKSMAQDMAAFTRQTFCQ